MLMERIEAAPALSQPGPAAAPAPAPRYLHGPIADFMLLGGSSLFLLPLLFLLPDDAYQAPVALVALLLANVVNHPHFAHSYQIFYRGFAAKAFRGTLGRGMQLRYLVAGVLVPVLLAAFCLGCVATGNVRLLGLGGNVMTLFVGWHYVKQGYGMLMVDAALKRRFFNALEKKLLVANCYAVWLFAWAYLNMTMADSQLWGISYYVIPIPEPLVIAAGAVAALGALAAAVVLTPRLFAGTAPVNGIVAYAVSLYLWLVFSQADPLWFLVIPVLHSLQYLAVVWRFQINLEKDGGEAERPGHRGRLARFVVTGCLLGAALFWAVPVVLDASLSYDRAVFGSTMFLFVFWIVINVHHYFMDNVMWRRENPDTKKYLFG